MSETLRALLSHELGGEPDFVETHVSLLAFRGDRVLKAKKPVRFEFLDLSTRERREAACRREVELNRRLAPDVYLGVIDLRDASGSVFAHAVEMRRMPEDRRLARLATRGEAGACLDAVAERLAAFHASAGRSPTIDAAASRDAVRELWEAAFAETAPFVGGDLPADDAERVAHLARRYLEGRAALFAERIAAGRACDGHGDLLADDVFCLDDGPRILDCLEFDDRLRHGDVVADVAFLAMDLERLGHADDARSFLERYRRASDDAWPASYEHHWVAYRAHVRAKVACLAGPLRPRHGEHAATLLTLSRRHLEAGRVRLVLVGGLPGTGKSTLAAALHEETTWPVLRSDVVRKGLAQIDPTDTAAADVGRGVYGEPWTERTYAALLAEAARHLARGESTIVDASFTSARHRARARAVARDTASDLVELECVAPTATARARIESRGLSSRDPSDATPEVAEAMRATADPWPEATRLDTAVALDGVVRRARAVIGLD